MSDIRDKNSNVILKVTVERTVATMSVRPAVSI